MGVAEEPRLRERPRDAEVDDPWRDAHHDVGGLQVQVDDPLAPEVNEHREQLQRERQQLFLRERPTAHDPVQRRALDALEEQVRVGVEGGAEPADERGMTEAREEVGFALPLRERAGVAEVLGPEVFATRSAKRRSSQTR